MPKMFYEYAISSGVPMRAVKLQTAGFTKIISHFITINSAILQTKSMQSQSGTCRRGGGFAIPTTGGGGSRTGALGVWEMFVHLIYFFANLGISPF